jgi:hypothetical protein
MDLAVMNMSKWDNTMPWRAVLTQIVAVKQHDIIHLSTPPSLSLYVSLRLCLRIDLKHPWHLLHIYGCNELKKKRMQMKI